MKWMKKNKFVITMFIVGLLLGLLLMSFKIKENNVKLKDTNDIVSFDQENTITSDEYYAYLKESTGINHLLDLIDQKLLANYTLDNDKIKEIASEMQEIFTGYMEYYNTTKQEFLTQNGFKNEEDFLNYLKLEEKRLMYEKDYLKEKVTNSEINYYYLNKMNKDMEIKYLKGKQEVLEKILLELNDGKTYDEIVKKHKNITSKNLGYIAFDDKEIKEDIYSDALTLENNSYTTSLRSIDDEYYIIFRGQEKEKDSVENLRDRIKVQLVQDKIDEDSNNKYYFEALINLRKKANITFYDTYLDNLYKAYIKEIS